MMHRNEKGFTFIELVLLIVILGIIGFVISTSVGDINSIKLNSAARRLASDIRYAQQLATTTQVRHGIIVLTSTSYRVFENDDTNNPARNPQGGGDFNVSFTSGELAGVTIATDLVDSVLRFESAGRPMEGTAPVALSAARQITLTYSSSAKSISIIPETGKLTY